MNRLFPLIFLVGCASNYVAVPLPIPERPVLPKIQSEELQCLSDETFEKLRTRDVIQEGQIYKLEGILRATHK